MMRFVSIMVAVGMCGAVTLTSSRAQETTTAAQVTQAELAQLLVNVTGLARFLPTPSTDQENFAALLVNGISPADGWVANKVVTKADLARVTVQALGRADEIENPDDPNAWVSFLKENGIPIDTVGQAVGNTTPIPEPVAGYVFAAGLTTDPLRKIQVFGEPDEKQFGVDVAGPSAPGVIPEAPPPPPIIPPPPAPRPPEDIPIDPGDMEDILPPTPEPPTEPVTPVGGEGSDIGQALIQAIINGIIENLQNPPDNTPTDTTPPTDVTDVE